MKTIQPIEIFGINGGVTATESDTHRLFGECLYAPDCRLSLISYHKLVERYSVLFDSEVGDLFTMTPKDPTSGLPVLTFAPGAGRLYHLCYELATVYDASFRHHTPRDPHTPRTQEEVHRAKGVLELHDGLNHPSDEALTKLLDNGGIIGCPWTSQDLRIARSIFGECVKCRVGKTTNPSAPLSQSPSASSPGELLHADIFFVTLDRGTKAPIPLITQRHRQLHDGSQGEVSSGRALSRCLHQNGQCLQVVGMDSACNPDRS